MESIPTDAPEVLETPEGTPTPEAPASDAPTAEQIAEWRRKAEERDELEKKNKQLFERAKKAEQKDEVSLSPADIIALRDVHEEDIESIQEWARFKGVSLADARKDKDLNIILTARAEERRTAAATQTSGARGAQKPSGADLLEKALRTNEVPEDEDALNAIALARMERLKRK